MNLHVLQRLKYLSITLDYRKDVTPTRSLALSELKTLTLTRGAQPGNMVRENSVIFPDGPTFLR